MKHSIRHLAFLLVLIACGPMTFAAAENSDFRLLVFSKTAGFRHASIEPGRKAVQELGEKHGFEVEATEDSAAFTRENLSRFAVVMFLNTTGTVLDAAQKAAFQGFIRAGGGFVGVHSAADTEYDWEWYGKLVGAYFKSHPRTQEAVIRVEDRNHPATAHLPEEWKRTDEWYDYRTNARNEVNVLFSMDTDSYEGSKMGDDHPIAWYHTYDGGRAFYTGLGHTNESFEEEAFLKHLLGAVKWAAGKANGQKRARD
jgi:cytochrome c